MHNNTAVCLEDNIFQCNFSFMHKNNLPALTAEDTEILKDKVLWILWIGKPKTGNV